MVSSAIQADLALICRCPRIVFAEEMYRDSISLFYIWASNSLLVTEGKAWKLLGKTLSITRFRSPESSCAVKRILNETGLEDAFQISSLYNVTFASYKQNGLQLAAYKLFGHRIKETLILKVYASVDQYEICNTWNILNQRKNCKSTLQAGVRWSVDCRKSHLSLLQSLESYFHKFSPLN